MLALPTASSGERRNSSFTWEGTQTPRRERHAHRWPSMVRGAVLALPTMSSGERRNSSFTWEKTQALRRERHAHRWPSKVRGAMLARPIRSSEGSGMLVGDPLGEGSNASFTDSELWEAEDSFLRMRGNSPFFIKKICPGLAGNFHLTSVRWSLRWLQGNYKGIRGLASLWPAPLSLTLAPGGGGAWVARLAFWAHLWSSDRDGLGLLVVRAQTWTL